MTDPARTDAPDGGLARPLLISWALAACVLIAVAAQRIARLQLPDPDDTLRLLEVRAWLAGQSWWDVGQYGFSGSGQVMHWSRLVDLPLAAAMVVLRPIFGTMVGDRIAIIVVPLLTLLAIMALVGTITRALSDRPSALLAILMVPLTAPVIAQAQPLRIDHHGWQVVAALCASHALICRRGWQAGLIAGIAAAFLVAISFEGFPFALLTLAAGGLLWVTDPQARAALRMQAATLIVALTLLHAATRGPAMFAPACDAVSPAWLGVIATAALGILAATWLPARSAIARFGWLALAGIVTIGAMILLVRDCAGGPFGHLDPLTRRVWFDNVAEGLPIWQQWPVVAVATFALPFLSIGATWRGMRQATDPAGRRRWAILLGLLVGATVCALMVLRAGALANALAVPAMAVFIEARLRVARTIAAPARRTIALAGLLALAAVGAVASEALLALGVPGSAQAHIPARYSDGRRPYCLKRPDVAALQVLPAGAVVLAPLDISPDIVLFTRLRPIASGHHRNLERMRFVLTSLMAKPAIARGPVTAYGVDYIVGCPGNPDNANLVNEAPHGLWARLENGERFDWLEPVPIPDSPILAWRVVRPLARPPA
ncbi:MAG: hypothetical protein PGN21_13470 [Sphingomonas paucimobilis]